jgi:uncharacterized RmlC-like cupin family protein
MAHGQGNGFSATAERDRADRFGTGQQDRATVRDRVTGQPATCAVIRPNAVGDEQGLTRTTGISRDSVGAKALCMQLVMLPPGTRGTPHSHNGHESALWVAMGEAEIWHGPGLCCRTVVHAGDFLYIPPGTPHLPVNRSETRMMVAVMARTDPAERESVVLCDLPPHLDGLFAVPVASAV